MNARKADQKQLKITVSEDIYSLLKRLAGVKETSMNKVVGEALDLYLESDHARELIDRHHLED
jgi:regulator of replication initiation timing